MSILNVWNQICILENRQIKCDAVANVEYLECFNNPLK